MQNHKASKQSNNISCCFKYKGKQTVRYPSWWQRSFYGSLDRLLKTIFHVRGWLKFFWHPKDGGFCNHGSRNIWIHVWSMPSVLKAPLSFFLYVAANMKDSLRLASNTPFERTNISCFVSSSESLLYPFSISWNVFSIRFSIRWIRTKIESNQATPNQ